MATRKLTAKQKSWLRQWYQRDNATCVDDLTGEQYALLEKINDTEILYQEVNRYLGDLWSKDNAEPKW